MIQTGHGGPLRIVALGALLLLLLLLALPPSALAAGNVLEVVMPRPASDQVALARVEVQMGLRADARGPLGPVVVRSVSRLPAGYDVAALHARRGRAVTMWLAAVRTVPPPFDPARPLRLKLRIGDRRLMYRRARTWRVAFGPATNVRGVPGCARVDRRRGIGSPVRGLSALALGDRVFTARTVVGAGFSVACDRVLAGISPAAADRFLAAVDRRFAGAAPGTPPDTRAS